MKITQEKAKELTRASGVHKKDRSEKLCLLVQHVLQFLKFGDMTQQFNTHFQSDGEDICFWAKQRLYL